MQNKQLKIDLLNNGKYKEYSAIRHELFLNNQIYCDYTDLGIEDKKADMMWDIYWKIKERISNKDLTFIEYKSCEQIRKNRGDQRKRIKDHVKFWYMMDYEILFSTYTFNQETLMKYGELGVDGIYINTKQAQDLLTRILSKKTIDYIGNVDYGTGKKYKRKKIYKDLDQMNNVDDKEHHRLHYHVIEAVNPKSIKEEMIKNDIEVYTPTNIEWEKYGHSESELVRFSQVDRKKISGYLAKLCSHSIKVKTNRLFIKKGTEYKRIRKTYEEKFKYMYFETYLAKVISNIKKDKYIDDLEREKKLKEENEIKNQQIELLFY